MTTAVTVGHSQRFLSPRQIERNLLMSDDPHNIMFCPPIFFSRNACDVPAAVRVADLMWSIMVMQNLKHAEFSGLFLFNL